MLCLLVSNEMLHLSFKLHVTIVESTLAMKVEWRSVSAARKVNETLYLNFRSYAAVLNSELTMQDEEVLVCVSKVKDVDEILYLSFKSHIAVKPTTNQERRTASVSVNSDGREKNFALED